MQRRLSVALGDHLPGALDDRRGAGIRFQASPASATALPWVGHLDFHVPKLGPVTVLAFHDQVANDDAAAHTGAEREKNHAVCVPAGSDPVFAEGRGIGVVLKSGRDLKGIPNVLPHRHVAPWL